MIARCLPLGPILVAAIAALHWLAATPAPADEPTLLIDGCSLFDPYSAAMQNDRTILIRGERIVAVAPAGKPLEVPPDAMRIDGRGKFVLPGLIDAHVHLVHVLDLAGESGEVVLPLYLAAGVTSVRSTGDDLASAIRVAQFADMHPASSPRVFTCSPLLDGDPPIHANAGRAVTDPAQVPAILDDLARQKVTTLKIYAGTARDVGRAVIDEGHRRGFFVTAHLGRYPAQQAVADGIDGLEHIWSVFNYSIPPDHTGHRGTVDLDNPRCADLVAEIAKRKTYVDPTLIVFRNMILLPDVAEVKDHPDNALAPPKLRAFWPIYLQRSGCPQGGALEDRRREFARYQELTGKLFRSGVPLLVGTDSPEPQVTPGFSLHQELELLVGSGLPPAGALQAATLHNAVALKQAEHLGSIEPGKLADLVVLSANPLDDIRNTRRIDAVIRGGKVLRPADLLRLVPRQ
ncbi:MAG: amidohydrolase family protein [Pirellulales bacterium]